MPTDWMSRRDCAFRAPPHKQDRMTERASIFSLDLARNLRSSEPYQQLKAQLGEVVRLPIPAAAWVAELLARDLKRPLLVLAPHEVDAYAWVEAARLFAPSREAVYFPSPSLSPYQEAETSLLVRAEEARTVDRIVRGHASTVVTTPRALFRRLPPALDIGSARLDIETGEEIPIDDLIEHLLHWGYHRSDLVFEVGQFAVRGGVFDLFPARQPTTHSPGPLRRYRRHHPALRAGKPTFPRHGRTG